MVTSTTKHSTTSINNTTWNQQSKHTITHLFCYPRPQATVPCPSTDSRVHLASDNKRGPSYIAEAECGTNCPMWNHRTPVFSKQKHLPLGQVTSKQLEANASEGGSDGVMSSYAWRLMQTMCKNISCLLLGRRGHWDCTFARPFAKCSN